ncbi:MAG: DUF2637 domain-containing protein [Acetobacteraceae bacterium]
MTTLTPPLDGELNGSARRMIMPPQAPPRMAGHASMAIKIAIGAITPLICLLAMLGGIGSFATIRQLAVPWFSSTAWIVPVGIDIGILALLAWDLLIEYLGFPWPVPRWVAWAFIGATVYLNIAAAHGNLTAAVMHAAMPLLFITVVEAIRHLLRQLTGLATGTRIERIPASRWLLAPRSSFLLARRMVLWQVTSYRHGLALEYQRLQAVARLQETYGQYLWRWKAPLRDRLALRLASAGTAIDFGGISPVDGAESIAAADPPAEQASPAEKLLSHLPQRCLTEPPRTLGLPNDPDRILVATAAEILRNAERQGIRISQAALARKLRKRGHRVANERLRWLVTTVQRTPPSHGAS